MRVNICGIEIDRLSFHEAVNAIVHHALSSTASKYVVTPNAHHIVTLQKDAHFREVYQHAFLSVPDGVPLVWAAKFLGKPLQGRVNGTDLFERLCAIAAERQLKVFFLGGRPGAADRAAQILRTKHPGLEIVGTYCPPYGFEADPTELEKINSTIKAAVPHILFVGLGAPKQENWIYANYKAIGVPISIGIGVSFELVSGIVTRAPKLLQNTGLEWFFRLLMEPRRLWRRYVVGNTHFVLLVMQQRFGLLQSAR